MNWKYAAAIALGIVLVRMRARSDGNLLIDDVADSLPKGNGVYEQRSLSDIERIVVHHTAGSASATPVQIAQYHINHRGWPGIGYHYVISKEGKIYLTNHLTTKSYHVLNMNKGSIGVCMVGNFDDYEVPPVQYAALKKLLRNLRQQFTGIPIYPHRHYQNKSCPGDLVMPHLFPQGGGTGYAAIGSKDDIASLLHFSTEQLAQFADNEAVQNSRNTEYIKKAIFDIAYLGDISDLKPYMVGNYAYWALYSEDNVTRQMANEMLKSLRYIFI